MPKIETKITYNNRPIQRLHTCARHSITINSHYRQDPEPISFLGFDVYIYDTDSGNYVDDYLIFVDPSGEVKGILKMEKEGLRSIDFQTP